MDTSSILELWSFRPMTMRLERPEAPQCDIDYHRITVHARYMDLVQYTELFASPCNSLQGGIRKWQDMVQENSFNTKPLRGKVKEWKIRVNDSIYTFYGIIPRTLDYTAAGQTITTTARLGFDAYDIKEV